MLSIPGQPANTGHFLTTAVSLATEGAQLSGLQFDLRWEDGLEVQIAAGRRLIDAGKLVYVASLGTRHMRVVVAGMNGNVLSDGEILRLFVAVNSIDATAPVTLSDMIGATAAGDAVAIRATNGILTKDPAMPVSSIAAHSVLNAASLQPGPLAPGEVVTLLGAFGINANDSPGVRASVNGAAATVLYALGNQVNAILPLDMDPSSAVEFELRDPNRQLARILLPAAEASPALFTQNASGIGPGAILNEDYTVNSPVNPATTGSIVMMYGTAFGTLQRFGGNLPPVTSLSVSATIGGAKAEVTYAGAAPGLSDGLVQINVRVPATAGFGDYIPISLRAGNFAIPNGVTLSVR